MMLLGFPCNYTGDDFGALPVYVCGRYKLVQVVDIAAVPADLEMLLNEARVLGAQWLIVSPDEVARSESIWFDTQRLAA